jgi:hypothetical protein
MFTFPGTMGRFKRGKGFTYEFVDCETGLTTIARFVAADRPKDKFYCNLVAI